MRLRPHAIVLALAIGAGACRLLVGVDDHHLRDDADADTTSDGPIDGGPDANEDVSDAGDAGPYIVTVLATGRTLPSMLLSSTLTNGKQYVFWIEESVNDAGAIMRVIDQGTLAVPEVITLATNPRGMKFDPSSGILYTDDTRPVARLWHAGIAASTPTVVDTDLAGRSFEALAVIPPFAFTAAVDADDAGAHVRRTSLDASAGAECFTYTSPTATSFPSLVGDGVYLYIADSATGAILRTQRGCDETSTVFAAGQGAVAMTIDNGRVYWVTADGHVRSLDKAMAGPIKTYDVTLVAPGGIGDRNGTIYVTDEGAGIVYELPPAGDPVVVARGQAGPHAVVRNPTGSIYWSNRAGGEIVKATR